MEKVFGDVFFTSERLEDTVYIKAQWFGVQSVETVKEGDDTLLELMQEYSCPRLLNSNKKSDRSWDMVLEWAWCIYITFFLRVQRNA